MLSSTVRGRGTPSYQSINLLEHNSTFKKNINLYAESERGKRTNSQRRLRIKPGAYNPWINRETQDLTLTRFMLTYHLQTQCSVFPFNTAVR